MPWQAWQGDITHIRVRAHTHTHTHTTLHICAVCISEGKYIYIYMYFYLQQNLGLWVTCSASVPQDEQTFLINFHLINERCLTIRVVRDAEHHMITTESMVLLSLSLSLAHCRIVGDHLPCSDAQSQATVFGRNQGFFRTLEGAHNWH